jgi:hypothetical protein
MGGNAVGRITTTVTPRIASFTPASGAGGTTVTLTGINLAGATRVAFNGTPAIIVSDTATKVVATVPAGATRGHISITTRAGTATSSGTFSPTAAWVKVGAAPSGGFLLDVSCPDPTDCWAVGTQSPNTLIEHYDGNSWAVVSSPNAGAQNNLYGVACASATDCWAVGVAGTPPANPKDLLVHYDGASWSIATGPAYGLYGVACVATNDCWASGNQAAAIEHYDGTSWTIAASPTPVYSSGYLLYRVRCTSASDCSAVGATDGTTSAAQSLVEHYDGSSWSLVPVPQPTSDNGLNDVACTSSSNCWAVGCAASPPSANSCFGTALIEHFDGTSWTIVASPSGSNTHDLSAVACATSANCWVLDGFGSQNLVAHFNGTAWSVDPSVVDAVSVSCFSSGECWAVGSDIDHRAPG